MTKYLLICMSITIFRQLQVSNIFFNIRRQSTCSMISWSFTIFSFDSQFFGLFGIHKYFRRNSRNFSVHKFPMFWSKQNYYFLFLFRSQIFSFYFSNQSQSHEYIFSFLLVFSFWFAQKYSFAFHVTTQKRKKWSSKARAKICSAGRSENATYRVKL